MKKLAIVGAEPQTRGDAPYLDEEYEIWAISNWANAEWMKKCDAVIEIHNPSVYKNHPKDVRYWKWLQENDSATVYMQSPDRLAKKSVEMPIEELKALTGAVKSFGQGVKIINSSVAFALALAIYQGYKEIDIYGVEMAHSSEYRSQQPVFMFWVGYAAGKGVKLNINCSQGLFIQPIYGYESTLNTTKMHEYLDGLKQQKQETERNANMLDGAIQIVRQLLEE